MKINKYILGVFACLILLVSYSCSKTEEPIREKLGSRLVYISLENERGEDLLSDPSLVPNLSVKHEESSRYEQASTKLLKVGTPTLLPVRIDAPLATLKDYEVSHFRIMELIVGFRGERLSFQCQYSTDIIKLDPKPEGFIGGPVPREFHLRGITSGDYVLTPEEGRDVVIRLVYTEDGRLKAVPPMAS